MQENKNCYTLSHKQLLINSIFKSNKHFGKEYRNQMKHNMISVFLGVSLLAVCSLGNSFTRGYTVPVMLNRH